MKTPMAINGPQVRSLVKPAVTDAGGRFTLHGVGPGRIAELLIEGQGIESAKIFARTEAGEKIELVRERRGPDLGSYIYHPAELNHVAGPSMLLPQNYHLVAEIDPPADRDRVELNLQLDGGNTVVGRVVGPDDRPVSDYYYSGQMAQFADIWSESSGDTFELKGYDPESPRQVYFAHRQRHLATHLVVKDELPKDFVVRLQPAGKVRGRLVDQDGAPLGNFELVPWHPPIRSPADIDRTFHAAPLPRNLAHSWSGQYETDDQGRFEISCLAPGVEYRLRAFDRASMTPTRGRAPKAGG
jgi:hypothetical protein